MKIELELTGGKWMIRSLNKPFGADLFLDFIARNKNILVLDIRSTYFEDAAEMIYKSISPDVEDTGVYYFIEHYKQTFIGLLVYLTPHVVFRQGLGLGVPGTIYFKLLN